jgi:hypothetical protein
MASPTKMRFPHTGRKLLSVGLVSLDFPDIGFRLLRSVVERSAVRRASVQSLSLAEENARAAPNSAAIEGMAV